MEHQIYNTVSKVQALEEEGWERGPGRGGGEGATLEHGMPPASRRLLPWYNLAIPTLHFSPLTWGVRHGVVGLGFTSSFTS